MITSLSKSVVYCGDYGYITRKWFDFDCDKNNDMSWAEISKNNQLDTYDISEFIDNSEFVVRPSLLRTQSTSRWCEKNYGRKIDAMMTRLMGLPQYIDVSNSDKLQSKYYLGKIELIFSREWLYLNRQRHVLKKDTPVNIASRYGLVSNRIQSKLMLQEIWMCTCSLYAWAKLRMKKGYKKIKEIFDENVQGFYDEYHNVLSSDIKVLDYDSYMEWFERVRLFHLSLEEMQERWGHKKWWQQYMEGKKKYNTIEEMSFRLSKIKDNLVLNRGQECLALIFNDTRFKSFEKFFVGHHALWNAFEHGISHGNQFAEYLFITSLIKSGELKYIPEHIESLKEELNSKEITNKYYLHTNT